MNRGSDIARPGADAGYLRFNEAPIHESGKSSPEPSSGVAVPSLQ